MKRRTVMMMATGAVIAGVVLAAPATAREFLKLQTSAPGGAVYVMGTGIATIVGRHSKTHEIQVTANRTGTRMPVELAQGKADLGIVSPAILMWMRDGDQMYKSMRDHKELFDKVRSVISFPSGVYQWVVQADSGIQTLADLKGRKIFAGPRNTAAASIVIDTIKAETGLLVDKDYTYVSVDWASGQPAFQDRQVDVYVRPTDVPSGDIEQFALSNKIRLLPIKESTFKLEEMKPVVGIPGRLVTKIPPKAYGSQQVNTDPIPAIGSVIGYGSAVHVPEAAIYEVTKRFWENIGELHAVAAWTKSVTKETAFLEMLNPLHAGAWRYYKEAGFNPPEHLMPPELKNKM